MNESPASGRAKAAVPQRVCALATTSTSRSKQSHPRLHFSELYMNGSLFHLFIVSGSARHTEVCCLRTALCHRKARAHVDERTHADRSCSCGCKRACPLAQPVRRQLAVRRHDRHHSSSTSRQQLWQRRWAEHAVQSHLALRDRMRLR